MVTGDRVKGDGTDRMEGERGVFTSDRVKGDGTDWLESEGGVFTSDGVTEGWSLVRADGRGNRQRKASEKDVLTEVGLFDF